MGTNLTSTQMGDLERLFSTPVEQGETNAYMPEYVYNPTDGRTYVKQDSGYLAYNFNPTTDFSRAQHESLFNGENYDQYDLNGLFTNSGQFTGISDSNKLGDFIKGAAMMAPAFAAGISPTVNSALSFGSNPVMAGGSAATGGASAAGSSFGVVDSTVGGSSGTGNSLYSLGGGGTSGSGLGLQAGAGDGLTLASTTGAPGISASLGSGLDLAGAAGGSLGGGLGLDATVAGNAVLDGAGLGTGIANQTGTVLGPGVLEGTTTLSNGTVLQNTGGTTGGTTTGGTTTTGGAPTGGTTGGGSGSGSGFNLSDILGLAGGLWDYNNQKNASADMLAYLKERQGINDNMYKPGSDEYNALWDEMSRKDAAAGRNSQYGPRSVDLAARIAQLKMDANTRMTTGIGSLYKDSIDQGAGANAGILSALGALTQGDSGSGLNFSDIGDWIGDLFNGP